MENQDKPITLEDGPKDPVRPETRRTNTMPIKIVVVVLILVAMVILRVHDQKRRESDEPAQDVEPATGYGAPREPGRPVGEQPEVGWIENEVEAPRVAMPIELPPPPYNYAEVAAQSPLRSISQTLPRRAVAPVAQATLFPQEREAEPVEGPVEARLMAPATRFLVHRGTHIPAVLLSDLNTDLPATLEARTTAPIYDSVTGRIELLPEGCRLVGTPDTGLHLGQTAAVVTWNTLYLPDGRRLDLLDEPGADPRGAGGMRGRVNHHRGRLYLHSLFAGLIGAAFQVSQDVTSDQINDPTATAGAAVSQSLLSTSDAITQAELQYLQPTIVKDIGETFQVTLTREYAFEGAYR